MSTDKDTDFGRLRDHTGQAVLKYWPIIIAGAATLISLGGIFVKLDYIAKAIDRNDQQFSILNDRQNLTSQALVEIRGTNSQQAQDIARNRESIAALFAKFDLLQEQSRNDNRNRR